MKEEVKRWFKQAERDLVSAEHSLNAGDYYVAAFLAQQAVEKGLKALMLSKRGKLMKSHNIIRLAKELDLPKELLVKIAQLEPVYQETRYPDVSSKLPADEFGEKDATDLLNIGMEVLEWIKEKI